MFAGVGVVVLFVSKYSSDLEKGKSMEIPLEISTNNASETPVNSAPIAEDANPKEIVGTVTVSSTNPGTYVLTTASGEKFCVNDAPSYIKVAFDQNYTQYTENALGALNVKVTGNLTGQTCEGDAAGTSYRQFYPEYFYLQ